MLLGVCDGVSQLEEFNMDPSLLPNELRRTCEELAMLQVHSPKRGSGGKWAACRRRRSEGSIHVLTDMGFDDWGAFSILHATGHDPEAILAVSGMMEPSGFAASLAELISSWGINSPVYQATDGCHHDCLNSSFIWIEYNEDNPNVSGWGYRSTVHQYFPEAVKASGSEGVVLDGSEFPWAAECEEKHRLLILGPLSQFDYKVWEDPAVLKCISEVVVSGGFFGDSEEGRRMATNDISTWKNLIPLGAGNLAQIDLAALNAQGDGPPEGGSDSSTLRELNVVSDALAAARSLATAASKGVKITIIPLEVESINRYGQQVIENNNSITYSEDLQVDLTDAFIAQYLCRDKAVPAPNEAAGMLQRLACINEEGGKQQYTLDMDAIVATYLWAPEMFTFDQKSLVAFDSLTGMTYAACRRVAASACLCQGSSSVLACFEVQRATNFDAVMWFARLNELLG